jgi:hypothetical protein
MTLYKGEWMQLFQDFEYMQLRCLCLGGIGGLQNMMKQFQGAGGGNWEVPEEVEVLVLIATCASAVGSGGTVLCGRYCTLIMTMIMTKLF